MEEAEIWPSRWAPRGRTVLRGVLGAGAAVGGGAIWPSRGLLLGDWRVAMQSIGVRAAACEFCLPGSAAVARTPR